LTVKLRLVVTAPRSYEQVLILGALAVSLGCAGEFTPGISADGGSNAAARQDFVQNVEPILQARCYSCHAQGQVGAPKFGNYEEIIAYTGEEAPLIACTKEQSHLYTKGAHVQGAAPAFDAATEAPKVAAFIEKWAMSEPSCQGPAGGAAATGSLVFNGTNTVDLSVLGPGLDGATFTFTASAAGGGLSLTNMTLQAGANGLHLVKPRFELCPAGTAVLDSDQFAAVDVTIAAGESQPLTDGSTSIIGATIGGKYALRFATITPAAGPQGAAVDKGGACAAP
jgi:hypothetical protein